MSEGADLPPVLDRDAVPPDLLVTEEKLREIAGDEDPGILSRYLDLLSVPPAERCASAARGAAGLYWPCARPTSAGNRYCFAHADTSVAKPRRGLRGRLRRR